MSHLVLSASMFNSEHVDSFPFEAMTTVLLLPFPKQVCFQTSRIANVEKESQIW